MEVYATRQSLRLRLLPLLGFAASDADSAMVTDQLNELVRRANNDAAAECLWARRRQEATGTIGVDQETVNLPSGASVGDVAELAVWDATEKRYVPLEHRLIRLPLRHDPLHPVGGADDEARRGRPSLWDYEGAQLRTWPAADLEYQYRLVHHGIVELTEDATVSAVDADLIQAKALAVWFSARDPEASAYWLQEYGRRLRQLRSWRSTLETACLDPAVRFHGGARAGTTSSRYDYTGSIDRRA